MKHIMNLKDPMSAPPLSTPISPPMDELLVVDTPAEETFHYVLDMVQLEEPVTQQLIVEKSISFYQ